MSSGRWSSGRWSSGRWASGRWRLARAWLAWGAAMSMVTLALVPYRERIDQVHAVLPLLLVVLFGSATGGRPLGFALAAAGFLLIDYFFQQPYDTLTVEKPLDWVVLISFLITAGVVTQLLTRARAEAEAARRRTEEVRRLADLGAETLSAGRAGEAVDAIAMVVHRTLALARCDVFHRAPPTGGVQLAATVGEGPLPDVALATAERVLVADASDGDDDAADAERHTLTASGSLFAGAPHEVFLPLRAHQHVVGVLRLVRPSGLALDEQQRTFLAALAHYAALAIERVRLVAEAERAEALREADRLKDMVLASVSHDLRTPLTTIKALAHAAATRGEADAVVIEEQADRLSRMVADLLDLSRARGGALPLDVQLNTVEDLIGAAVRQVSGLLGQRPLLKPQITGEEPLVGRFDFVAALRALGNLLENALKYSPPDTTVELTARRLGDMHAVTVADRGPGIPIHDQSRIFTPFYRSESTPADVGGAGLGLAVARTLAEAQGGSLTYTPRPGGGSAFTLRLPAADIVEADLAPDIDTQASDTPAGDTLASNILARETPARETPAGAQAVSREHS